VVDVYEIRSTLAASKIGDSLKLKVLRAGSPGEVAVTLGERPAR
jgi:S1-C subfamily serine protease